VAKEKKKKETSWVKYNTSGHYRWRRYNQYLLQHVFYFVLLVRTRGLLNVVINSFTAIDITLSLSIMPVFSLSNFAKN